MSVDREVTRLQRLCVALEQQVARYRDAHGEMAGAVSMLMSALSSQEYRCRGDHWSRRLTDDEQRVLDGYDDSVTGEDAEWLTARGTVPLDVMAIGLGQCNGTITVEMESECDDMGYTLCSYPVASGDCAEALRLDEDEDYSHPIWAEMSQRQYLRGVIDQVVSWTYGKHLVRDLRSQVTLAYMDIERLRAQVATLKASHALSGANPGPSTADQADPATTGAVRG